MMPISEKTAESHRGREWLVYGAGILVAASLGAVLGFWHGVAAAPLLEIQRAECETPLASEGAVLTNAEGASADSSSRDALSIALGESFATNVRLAAKLHSLEALLEELEHEGVTAAEAARRVIEGMSEDDLALTIGMLTRMSEDELDEIRDIRGYATRLSEIAISGTLEGLDDFEDGWDDDLVLFSDERNEHDPRAVASEAFDPETDRIWAMVPVHRVSADSLMVKWERSDRREILRLRRRPIPGRQEWVSFFLSKPMRWPAGQYRVTVYTGDEAMTPIAMGTYRVVDEPDV